MKTAIRILPLAVLAIGLNACTPDDTSTAYDTAMPTTAAPTTDPSAVDIGDIDMGRHIGPDMKITDKTDDFAPTDTIYASVPTKGGVAAAQVTARWTFEDGTMVGEETKTVSGGTDVNTAFHIVKAGGWPKGKYTLHVLVDGREVKTKDVTVE